MKSIRYGDKNKLLETKMFDCNFCWCLFEADNTEYKVDSQYNEIYYYVRCPVCGRFVHRGED